MTLTKWKRLFSQALLQRMDELDISQKELAKLCDVGEASMSYYVSGKRVPTADKIVMLANALDCSTDELINFGVIERKQVSI